MFRESIVIVIVIYFKFEQIQIQVTSSTVKQSGTLGCPETSANNNQHCVTSQKCEDLIYTVVEA
jgi:hypothetical protein